MVSWTNISLPIMWIWCFALMPTGSMRHVIDIVKENALHFYQDVVSTMKKKNKIIDQLRVRVITFRDYLADGERAMMSSDFFTLPEDEKN